MLKIPFLFKKELESRLQEKYIKENACPLGSRDDLIKVISGQGNRVNPLCPPPDSEDSYVNFDDERLTDIGDYDEIVSAVNAVYGNPRNLLFDEIQNLPRWEMFANRLQRQGFRLLITGSNANLLSSEFATHLTGRHAAAVLFTFTFGEYLSASGDQLTEVEKRDALDVYAEQEAILSHCQKDRSARLPAPCCNPSVQGHHQTVQDKVRDR
jgi:hypothetical protein